MTPARGRVVVPMALVQTSALLPRRRQTTHLTVLVHRVHDPVDAWVAAHGLVHGIHEDDLVVLVRAVLVDPVGIEHAQVGAATTHPLFCGRLQGTLIFELVDTLVSRFA